MLFSFSQLWRRATACMPWVDATARMLSMAQPQHFELQYKIAIRFETQYNVNALLMRTAMHCVSQGSCTAVQPISLDIGYPNKTVMQIKTTSICAHACPASQKSLQESENTVFPVHCKAYSLCGYVHAGNAA
jgi:hypothetical protein